MRPLHIKNQIKLKLIKNLIPVFISFLIFGCSSDDNSVANPPDPVLNSLEISSSNGNVLDLNGSNTITLSATGRDQSGQPIAIDDTIEWSASNNNASINQNGVVTGISTGNSVLTANVGSISKAFNITIVDSTPQTGTFIYVSDAGNFDNPPWQILKYDENGQNPQVFTSQNLAWPQDILFLEDQNIALISNLNSGVIGRYDATTGVYIDNFAAGIGGPTRMKIGPDGLLYVLQWAGDGLVLRYQLDGTFVDQFTNVGVTNSIGLDWDASGNLYVSSFNGALVRKFDSNGNSSGVFINSNLNGPTNIWFDENDNLFVSDWNADSVVKFDSNGVFVETVITSGIDEPEGVDFFPNGNFLIGSGGTSEVKLYDGDGNFIQTLINSGSGGLIQPNAIRIREIN